MAGRHILGILRLALIPASRDSRGAQDDRGRAFWQTETPREQMSLFAIASPRGIRYSSAALRGLASTSSLTKSKWQLANGNQPNPGLVTLCLHRRGRRCHMSIAALRPSANALSLGIGWDTMGPTGMNIGVGEGRNRGIGTSGHRSI
jgi:hypothetical protein